MPELLDRAAFADCLHTSFHLAGDPDPGFALELVEVTDLKTFSRQQTFSLFFHAPDSRYLPQQTYRLVHNRLGEMDLFMVPVGQKAGSFIYEAVFNRLLP
jgi:hypothetical protein